jgi:hypothetical protein
MMGDGFWKEDDSWPEESEQDADLIDDPEALRRAERAVAHLEDEPVPWVPTDAEWLPVAVAGGSSAWTLCEVREVLEAEGIPAGYDPYDPRDAITLPYGLPRLFRVIVPAERLGDALRIVAELAAGGAGWSMVEQGPRP